MPVGVVVVRGPVLPDSRSLPLFSDLVSLTGFAFASSVFRSGFSHRNLNLLVVSGGRRFPSGGGKRTGLALFLLKDTACSRSCPASLAVVVFDRWFLCPLSILVSAPSVSLSRPCPSQTIGVVCFC